MSPVMKILKANNSLYRGTDNGKIFLVLNWIYRMFGLICIIPCILLLFKKEINIENFVYFYYRMFGVLSFYVILLYSSSGYMAASNSRKGLGQKMCLLKIIHFMPFKKLDYIKAAFLTWFSNYLVLAVPLCVVITSYYIYDVSAEMKAMLGFLTFYIAIAMLISSIMAMLTLFVKKSCKYTSGLVISIPFIGIFLIFSWLLPMIFERTKFDAKGFDIFCSPLGDGIIIGIIPIVGLFSIFMLKLSKNKSWFNE